MGVYIGALGVQEWLGASTVHHGDWAEGDGTDSYEAVIRGGPVVAVGLVGDIPSVVPQVTRVRVICAFTPHLFSNFSSLLYFFFFFSPFSNVLCFLFLLSFPLPAALSLFSHFRFLSRLSSRLSRAGADRLMCRGHSPFTLSCSPFTLSCSPFRSRPSRGSSSPRNRVASFHRAAAFSISALQQISHWFAARAVAVVLKFFGAVSFLRWIRSRVVFRCWSRASLTLSRAPLLCPQTCVFAVAEPFVVLGRSAFCAKRESKFVLPLASLCELILLDFLTVRLREPAGTESPITVGFLFAFFARTRAELSTCFLREDERGALPLTGAEPCHYRFSGRFFRENGREDPAIVVFLVAFFGRTGAEPCQCCRRSACFFRENGREVPGTVGFLLALFARTSAEPCRCCRLSACFFRENGCGALPLTGAEPCHCRLSARFFRENGREDPATVGFLLVFFPRTGVEPYHYCRLSACFFRENGREDPATIGFLLAFFARTGAKTYGGGSFSFWMARLFNLFNLFLPLLGPSVCGALARWSATLLLFSLFPASSTHNLFHATAARRRSVRFVRDAAVIRHLPRLRPVWIFHILLAFGSFVIPQSSAAFLGSDLCGFFTFYYRPSILRLLSAVRTFVLPSCRTVAILLSSPTRADPSLCGSGCAPDLRLRSRSVAS
ncbi:uncharacterized protein G2W53_033603 [Senna tora]|uniref:Uncharacterized protein n=1 Tax=Senna tora TaxID=362788 RepID=A0A834T2H6_9FABA|nr:uncharacterized protein G2W53_033603 [Senna tora]